MNKNILIEIGVEEIPARFLTGIISDLKEKTSSKLKSYRVDFEKIETYGTPRRVTIFIEKISAKQKSLEKEVKGPPVKAGQTAAAGFAKSQGLKIENLATKKLESGEYYFANVSEKGKNTEEILSQFAGEIIKSIYMPVSMLWGNAEIRFIRPIHWILALYGDKIINLSIGDIKASNITHGHRFFDSHPGYIGKKIKIEAADIAKYKKYLEDNYVIVDQTARQKMIKDSSVTAAKKIKGKISADQSILEEVCNLCEYPHAVIGQFDESFLKIPKEVLITSMIKHQKYFPVLDNTGGLLPYFVITSNNIDPENDKTIKEGNEKVIGARLADAKFFFDEDLKIPLITRLEQLKKTVLHEKLGTVYDKVGRLAKLSLFIGQELGLSDEQKDNIIKISELSKTDLATGMVYEFPELQGIIGREYAKLQGISDVIASGIFEHYLPRTADDSLPQSVEGIVVSIADKIDSLVGFFGQGLIPTGSEDPFALRRAAFGITKILLKNDKITISLEKVISKSISIYSKDSQKEDITSKCIGFILQRLKAILTEEKIRGDFVEAVLSGDFYSITDSYNRVKALADYSKKEWFKDLFLTADRIARISAQSKRKEIYESEFICTQERELFRNYKKTNGIVIEHLKNRDYEDSMVELSKLAGPINEFFEGVMVMVENPVIRDNRLALLKSFDIMFKRIADFTKVAM